MNLEQAAFIAEIVAAIGVVFSLCFLAFELRRGTERAKRDAVDLITSNRTAVIGRMVADAELFQIVFKCMAGNKRVPDYEFSRFGFYLYSMFVELELGFSKHLSGDINALTWSPWVDAMRYWLKYPGVRSWWRTQPTGFSAPFVSYVDSLIDKTPLDGSDAIRVAASYEDTAAGMSVDS